METVMDRVRKVLQKQFSAKEILLQNAGGGMVGGWIISNSFDGLDGLTRQQKVWKLFDSHLNEKDRVRIVGFHTFTPLEKKMAFEDGFDEFKPPSKKKASSSKKKAATTGRARNGARSEQSVSGTTRSARKK